MMNEVYLNRGSRNDNLPTTDDGIRLPRSLSECKKARPACSTSIKYCWYWNLIGSAGGRGPRDQGS